MSVWWFNVVWLEIAILFFLLFPSFSSLDCVLVMQKFILVLQFIFPFDSVSLFLFVIIFFTLIISNLIFIFYFIPSHFIFFFKFDFYSFNFIFFCFELFSWLIFFFSIPHLGIYFHLIFISSLVLILLIANF